MSRSTPDPTSGPVSDPTSAPRPAEGPAGGGDGPSVPPLPPVIVPEDVVDPENAAEPGWARAASRLAAHPLFRRTVLVLILAAGVLVGLETYGDIVAVNPPLFRTLDTVIVALFVVEILVRMAAYGRRPWRFFLDPWNVFDFVIVAVCLLPVDGKFAAVARLARVLRVLRLMSAIPRLQLIVNALFHAIPAISYVMLLVGLLFYVYAVIGTGLFGDNDPWHFGNLHVSLLTLFRVITLEDWTDVMYIQMVGSAAWDGYPGSTAGSVAQPLLATFYFVSFVLIGTMIVLNFFVGVVLNSLDESQKKQAARLLERASQDEDADELVRELAMLARRSAELQERIARLAERHAAVAGADRPGSSGDGGDDRPGSSGGGDPGGPASGGAAS